MDYAYAAVSLQRFAYGKTLQLIMPEFYGDEKEFYNIGYRCHSQHVILFVAYEWAPKS
jgi:hypothetical protein